ncbi:MAG: hypothetical protein WAV05_10175 [Anaerolineales bacterium]
MLVSGDGQLVKREGWLEKIGAPIEDTGNATNVEKVKLLSEAINLPALRAYRVAVGQNTRQIVSQLTAVDLDQKVDPARLEEVRLAGAVVSEAPEVLAYWGKKTISGLLLMPATRHCILHLNEGLRIKDCLSR